METERSLLDAAAARILDSLAVDERSLQFIHAKDEEEQTASDTEGFQGGQRWSPPTKSPTLTPTDAPSLGPSPSPTYHPTPHGEPYILKGTVWYDRNANSHRDSSVSVTDMGTDVEFTMGLGGVVVRILECDVETNRLIESSDATAAAASTISQGFVGKMEPALSDGGGVFRLVNIKIDRSYAVEVEAPSGYLFTTGICNDDERGWKCEYTRASSSRSGSTRTLQRDSWFSEVMTWAATINHPLRRRLAEDTTSSHSKGGSNKNKTFAVGITSGRSAECITVDRNGIPSKTLDFGVMRVGDSRAEAADVALKLDFDTAMSGRRGRSLREMILDATELPRTESDPTTVRRYLLGERDKVAIGSVTAEVLASRLDKRLAENPVVPITLDAVTPNDVILSDDSQASNKELAVALNVQAHYSPPPDIDFEYLVNDSINSDTESIRRSLSEYNQNCRDQTAKVESGAGISDFTEIHSMQGARPNTGSTEDSEDSGAYMTACAEGETLPTIFETSLKEIQATKVSEIAFAQVLYVEEEMMESWAVGPLAAVSGLIALLMGVFVFRRALGPRKGDKYRRVQKTMRVDVGEERRFGEMGGDVDDGSVDSAFYSEYSDEKDLKDEEKRMRAKLRAEAEKAKSAGKSAKKFARSMKNFGKSTRKLDTKSAAEKLTVKSGAAEDTDSVPSNESPPEEKKRKKRSKRDGGDVKRSVHSSATSIRSSSTSNKSEKLRSSKRSENFRSSTNSTKSENFRSSTKSNKSENLRSSTKSNKSESLRSSTKSEKSRRRSSTESIKSDTSDKRGRNKREGGDNARIVDAELKKSIV